MSTYSLNWGMKDKNPLDFVSFYCPEDYGKSKLDYKCIVPIRENWNEAGLLCPKTYQEHYLRVYIKDEDKVSC